MPGFDADSGDVPLLTVYPLFQKIIMGSFSKKQLLHTKSQIVIMLSLSNHDALNMTQIAQYISSSNEQATRAVAPLVEEGYVERSTDKLNRTHVLVRLTEKGRAYISRHMEELRSDLNARMARSLTDDERSELGEAVRTMLRLLDKIQ